MDTQELHEDLLQPNGHSTVVVLKQQPRELKLTRDEFVGLFEDDVHPVIADILKKAFLGKLVMTIDPVKDKDPELVIGSLKEIVGFLKPRIDEWKDESSETKRGLLRLLQLFKIECELAAWTIKGRHQGMIEGNRGEFESDYRVRPSVWLPKMVREFRLAVYPYLRFLIDTLPESDPTRRDALKTWYEGRKLLDEQERDQVIPSWRKESSRNPVDALGLAGELLPSTWIINACFGLAMTATMVGVYLLAIGQYWLLPAPVLVTLMFAMTGWVARIVRQRMEHHDVFDSEFGIRAESIR